MRILIIAVSLSLLGATGQTMAADKPLAPVIKAKSTENDGIHGPVKRLKKMRKHPLGKISKKETPRTPQAGKAHPEPSIVVSTK